jgi:branched-chain amino acid aminotransferase
VSNYCVFSGKLISEDEAWLLPSNRAFLYGDGLFESIYFNGSQPLYLEDHIDRLLRGMQALNFKVPDYFSVAYFTEQIERIAKRNRIFRPARIRLQIYREADGLYSPEHDLTTFLLQIKPLSDGVRSLNSKGLLIDVFPVNSKKYDAWSAFKSVNAQLYVQAGIWKRNFAMDDCLILNTAGRVCETISSNIFIIKSDYILTPPIDEGCIDGIMRRNVIRNVKESELSFEETPLTLSMIEQADEVFLSNAIQGIKWVGSFRNQRFFCKRLVKIAQSLELQTD